MKILSHIKNEMYKGLEDNLNGIKQIGSHLLHPITTTTKILTTCVDSIKHPIRAVQNLGNFIKNTAKTIWQHPLRVGTNLTLSYLEGRALGAVVNTSTAALENFPAANAKPIPMNTYNNITVVELIPSKQLSSSGTLSVTSLNGYQNFQRASTALPRMTCNSGVCTLSTKATIATGNTTAMTSSTVVINNVNNKKSKKINT
jgi:hypothetical protein